MVSVAFPEKRRVDFPAAYFAGEAFGTGVSLVVAFIMLSAFVFSVHAKTSSSEFFCLLGSLRDVMLSAPDLPA